MGLAFCRVAARAERCVLGVEGGFQARGFTGMPFSPAGRIKLFVQLAVQKYHGRVWTPRAAEEQAADLGVCSDCAVIKNVATLLLRVPLALRRDKDPFVGDGVDCGSDQRRLQNRRR